MPDLPSVTQEWDANTAPYVSAMDAAISVTEGLVSEAHNATAAILELQAALDSLHGRNVSIGIDTSAASAAAAAAAMADLTRAEEGAGAGAAAAAAAAADLAAAQADLGQASSEAAVATYAETLARDGAIRALLEQAAAEDGAAAAAQRSARANDEAATAARRTVGTYRDLVRTDLELGAAEQVVWDAMQAAAGQVDALAARNVALVATERELSAAFKEAAAAIAAGETAADGAVEELTTQLMDQVAAAQAAAVAEGELAAQLREVTRASIEAAAAQRAAAEVSKQLGSEEAFVASAADAVFAAQTGLTEGAAQASAAYQMLGAAQAFVAGEAPKVVAAAQTLRDELGAGTPEAEALSAALIAGGASARNLAGGTDQAAAASRRALNGFTGWLGGMNKVHVALFSGVLPGILGSVTGLHLLADAAIETAAVIIPASIALASFGVAAAPAIQDITHHLQALYTVSQATSQAVYPMTGAFTRVADAVRPQVFQLFGEALGVINHNTGTFMNLATSAGSVLDQLGARLEMALTSGNGFHIFLANATQDLAKLGDMVGNVGGILGNVLRTVPGYAQYLLTFADNVTKVGEAITGSGLVQGIMSWGLKAHGALLYTGLLATGLDKLLTGFGRFPGILSLASDGLGKAALAAGKLGGEGNIAEHALGSLSSTLSMMQGLPWGWITLLGTAFGIAAYKIYTAKDAMGLFIQNLNTQIGSLPLAQLASGLSAGITEMNSKLAVARTQFYALSPAARQGAGLLSHFAGAFTVAAKGANFLSDSVNRLVNVFGAHLTTHADILKAMPTSVAAVGIKAADYQAAQNELAKLSRETVTYQARLGLLAHAFGGASQAMGILTAAGIKSSDMINGSAQAWAKIIVQVQATVAAYRAMGQIGGVLGADMNAMTIAGSEQVTQMAKLNQAWDSTISIVSGGQSAFVSFEQALGSGYKSISGVAAAAKVAGASMGGMNTQSLALRAAWQNAYTSGSKVVDALRMMISASPQAASQNKNLTQSVKDVVAQLSVQGSKSAATRAELVSLAQEVNPNIRNFQQLRTWLGNTGNAGQDLNRRLAAMGINIQNLASDASQLSGAMQQHIVNAFGLAKMAVNGTDTAIKNLATAMSTTGDTAGQQQAKLALFHDLVQKDGFTAQQAATLISGLTGQIFKIPPSHTTKILMNGIPLAGQQLRQVQQLINSLQSKTITVTVVQRMIGSVQPNYAGPGSLGHNVGAHGGMVTRYGIIHAAGGAILPGFAPGRDIVPAMLSPGEAILNPYATRVLGAPFIQALNGMAERGVVNPGALAMGGGSGGYGAGHGSGDIVVNVDGESLFRIMQTRGYRWQTRNAGVRTGLSVPGNQVGRA